MNGPCPLCGGTRFIPFRAGLKACEACDLVVDANVWKSGANEAFEAEWFDEVGSGRSAWVRLFEEQNNQRVMKRILARAVGGKRLLEIGIGSGSFLELAKRRGFEVLGCDLSPPLCEHARSSLGVETHCGQLSELADERRFDVIVMNHVLEHVHDPKGMLAEVRRRLAPGGLLHIAVPNVGSWDAMLPGWTSYEPYHLIYFTPRTLAAILSGAGFRIEELSTRESFSGWFLALLRTMLRAQKSSGISRAARRRSALVENAYRVAMVGTGAVTFPLRLLQGRFGYGDEIVALAIVVPLMCGIAGFTGRFSLESLARSSDLIAHRGPDASGIWHDEAVSVGLAHRRLSIIDLSPTGAQPMKSPDGRVVLVFNGEIYNYRELRAGLESRGHQFRGTSDTEVMLHLYLERGEEMLQALNGIFAFAMWDSRSSELFVARDALGVKPLYFHEGSRGFAFASEIKALLAMVPEARELDLAALDRYLTYLWCPGDGTPLKAVRKLNPGEALKVREGRISRLWAWYRLPAVRGIETDLGEKESVEGTAESLRRAVQRQLVSDVPVGAFLSGGLDSSAVVAFAREQIPGIQCFTIDSGSQESGATDDLPYARRVATHLGVPLHVVEVDPGQMARDFQSMVVQLDEPLADPAPLNVLYISRLARAHGIKVLMSGAGGDDLFTGYRRHAALEHEWMWRWLPRTVRRALSAGTSGLDQRVGALRRMTRLLQDADLDGNRRLTSYYEWTRPGELSHLRSADFSAAVDSIDPRTVMLDFLDQVPRQTSKLEAMLALEQRFFLADHNLLYTDKMSMAAGVEVRVPFLDLDLVEHAARIPGRYKQRGRVGKWALKKAMQPYLPSDVIHRPKTGFGAPLRRWMRSDLRGLVDDLLGAESIRRRGLFRADAVQRLIQRNDAGKVDGSYTLFSMLAIEVWCRAFLDASGPGSVS